ncbi:MAG: hypothetical protein LBT93_08015 [Treponema sp.]|jgi:hypothetical protein|nr:hypothetical protein [Treponema sp.]
MDVKETLQRIFAQEPTLKEIAREKTYARPVNPDYPGVTFDRPMGRSPRLYTPAMKGVVWGAPQNLTLSMLKTDIFDRRYFRTDPVTVKEVMEGAYSEANKNYDDMPRVGLTRPKYGTLLPSGGRIDRQAWSENYPFPCQKAVGQIILKAEDLKGAHQPEAVISMSDGSARVDLRKEGAKLSVEYVMGMKRNVIALKADFEGLTSPLAFRLYRHQDQGHRRYMDEKGNYIPKEQRAIVYHPVDPAEPIGYYDYEADAAFNGPIDPPANGSSGRFFWIEQQFPGETTFPDGFRYVMVGLLSDPEAAVTLEGPEKYLGTPQRMPRDAQGKLILPFRSVGHDDLFYNLDRAFSFVREAPGVAGTARLPRAGAGQAVLYTAVVTQNEFPNYLEEAKKMLLEAEKLGYEGLKQENRDWYDALYDSREQGRIFLGGAKKAEADEKLFNETFLSWSYHHGGYCRPNPAKNEGSAGYAAFDVDAQAWHSLPCYNELFTEGPWFVRNRPEVMRQWPQLVWHWRQALKEKAKIIYDLPGLIMGHGYLPPVTPDPRYIENQSLDFCMEVPGQVFKVIWNLWDYTGDEQYLRETAYPLLRELAIFYEAFARRGWDGRYYHLEPTVETESYGISYHNEFAKDTTGAIAIFRYILRTAAETADYLQTDGDLSPLWREVAAGLPPYPTFQVGMGPILAGNPGIIPRWSAGDHEINSANYPATLADEITLDSPREDRELIIRTADTVRNNHNTEPYILTGAFADYTVCGYNKSPVKIEDASLLCDEILSAPERLLNSRSGRIHLFPVVPKDAVAAFRGCLARGGLEVSAAKDKDGVLGAVFKARRNTVCRVMNPWPGKAAEITGPSGPVALRMDTSNGECIEFETRAGEEYTLALRGS